MARVLCKQTSWLAFDQHDFDGIRECSNRSRYKIKETCLLYSVDFIVGVHVETAAVLPSKI